MTDILLGPTLTDGPTTKVKDKSSGKTYYKKQILPEGTYDYKTKTGEKVKLDLSGDQHKVFVQAFKDKAYDEVPFQIGHDGDQDLKARKGTLANVEYVPGKGTWGYFSLDDDAAKFVEKYPNFGVSPRLTMNLEKMDGRKFAGAIQHVAGTNVPRASGLSPWEKIELSDDPEGAEVFDFSDETIKAHRDVKMTKTDGTGEDTTFTLTADEYKFFQDQKKAYEEVMQAQNPTPDQVQGAKAVVNLSEDDKKAIADAQKAAQDAISGLTALKSQALRDSWAAKKQLFLNQGVPPAALDLADPVMTSVDSQVYDLSDGEGGTVKVDAKTQMLGQLELMKGMIDLSGERGHGVTGVDPDAVPEDDMRAWMEANGL